MALQHIKPLYESIRHTIQLLAKRQSPSEFIAGDSEMASLRPTTPPSNESTIASHMPVNPSNLLNLPDDVLLLVLARIPYDTATIIRIQLVCRKLNILINTRSLHIEIVRRQFPVIGQLFYTNEPGLLGLTRSTIFQKALNANILYLLGFKSTSWLADTPDALAVVQYGLSLLSWLAYRSACCSIPSESQFDLENVWQKNRMPFAALLALKVTIKTIYGTICEQEKQELVSSTWSPVSFVTSATAQTESTMYMAFETALMHTICSFTAPVWTCSGNSAAILLVMRHLYHAIMDRSGLLMTSIVRNGLFTRPLPSSTPWLYFLQEVFDASPLREDDPFKGDQDAAKFTKMQEVFCTSTTSQYILDNLDLQAYVQNTQLDWGENNPWWQPAPNFQHDFNCLVDDAQSEAIGKWQEFHF